MYGTKARIGLIVPSLNTVIEPEMNAMVSPGVTVHATRLLFDGSFGGLEDMAKDVEQASNLLATARVDIIAYACTTGSMVKGIGWDTELMKRIEQATGIPATTTSTAVIRAFRELGVKKVAVATPYSEEFNQVERQFFAASEVKIVQMKGLDIHGEELRRSLPETTYQTAREVDTPEADAVFISCTGFKSITVIERLEKELKKYVFSSNTATLWDVTRRLGITDPIKGYGKLFEH